MKNNIKVSILILLTTGSPLYSIDIDQKLTVAKESFEKLDTWENPDPRLRYDQVSFLGSHNSFAALEEGFLYPQQLWSLEKQLNNGIRVLLLDFHLDSKGVARLCHDKCDLLRASHADIHHKGTLSFLQLIKTWFSNIFYAGKPNKTVLSFLEMLKIWLDNHTNQIVTLELENHIGNNKTFELIKQANLLPYALTPQDWNPLQHEQTWPTLEQMINDNRRLVIFDTGQPSQYGYQTDIYMQRNQYGTIDKDNAAEPRHGVIIKTQPRIFQMNYFGTVTSPLPIHNTPTVLKDLIAKIYAKGYIRPDQPINEITLDYVNLGNAMQLVNELNKEYAQKYLPEN